MYLRYPVPEFNVNPALFWSRFWSCHEGKIGKNAVPVYRRHSFQPRTENQSLESGHASPNMCSTRLYILYGSYYMKPWQYQTNELRHLTGAQNNIIINIEVPVSSSATSIHPNTGPYNPELQQPDEHDIAIQFSNIPISSSVSSLYINAVPLLVLISQYVAGSSFMSTTSVSTTADDRMG